MFSYLVPSTLLACNWPSCTLATESNWTEFQLFQTVNRWQGCLNERHNATDSVFQWRQIQVTHVQHFVKADSKLLSKHLRFHANNSNWPGRYYTKAGAVQRLHNLKKKKVLSKTIYKWDPIITYFTHFNDFYKKNKKFWEELTPIFFQMLQSIRWLYMTVRT
jgi:hypothetical protein